MDAITSDTVGLKLTGISQSFVNGGNVTSEDGIAVETTGDAATIANSLILYGGLSAIHSSGDNAVISNAERFITNDIGGTGVVLEGDNATFINNGLVYGGSMLLVTGNNAHIVNAMTMSAQDEDIVAIRFEGAIDTTFVNYGDVTGRNGTVLKGAAGNDTIVNSGKLGGHVDLGDGNDTFDNRGGEVSAVFGGAGNDRYYVGDMGTFIEFAGEGRDTVFSDTNAGLAENFEKLVLLGEENIDGYGNDARNVLTGNSGNNKMWGGEARDFFIFLANAGEDTIADFGNGRDRIDLSDIAGVGSFAMVKRHMEQVGSNVVIDLADVEEGFLLTIENAEIADLHRSSFIV
jgi:hypothetical protein